MLRMAYEQKKVLYLVTKSVWGGAQQYIYDLAVNLPAPFEALVAAGGEGPLFTKLNAAHVRTIAIPNFERDIRISKDLSALAAIIRLIRRERPDIIHLNSPKASVLGGIAVFFARATTRHYRPFILYTAHGWSFREDRPRSSRASRFIFSWMASLFRDHTILINTTDFTAAKRFLPLRTLTLIRNGIGAIDFLPAEEARRRIATILNRREPIDVHTRWIGTVAELTGNKGLGYLISAVRAIQFGKERVNFNVFIVGEGEDHAKLEKQIAALGLEQRVFLTGFIPDAARLLKAFDLFALPSLKEGLPYVLIQAMAAELPIVATSVGGIPDLVAHGENGFLISPKKPALLANAIQKLLLDSKMRKSFGADGRRKVTTHFRLRDMIEKTTHLYAARTPNP